MLPVVKDYKYVGSAKLWSQAESANPRQDLYQPDQFLPFLCLADPDERGAVLSVWPELVARLDHVVAEVLVVGQLLPLQAELLGGDVVIEQQLCPHGYTVFAVLIKVQTEILPHQTQLRLELNFSLTLKIHSEYRHTLRRAEGLN